MHIKLILDFRQGFIHAVKLEAWDGRSAALRSPDPACSARRPLAGRQRSLGTSPGSGVRPRGAEGREVPAGGGDVGMAASAPGVQSTEAATKGGVLAGTQGPGVRRVSGKVVLLIQRVLQCRLRTRSSDTKRAGLGWGSGSWESGLPAPPASGGPDRPRAVAGSGAHSAPQQAAVPWATLATESFKNKPLNTPLKCDHMQLWVETSGRVNHEAEMR